METLPRVFIYGSCVSRDPLELSSKLELVDYFARSSLGGAFRPPPVGWDPEGVLSSIKSNFQRRMVGADLKKILAAHILNASFDVLVLDFIDERMSTIEFHGSTITESAELKSAGLETDPEHSYEPWTELGMRRRREGIHELVKICDPKKIVVNRAFWATHDSNGMPFPYTGWISRNNAFLAEMYRIMEGFPGVRFIDYPEGLLVADASHSWGVQAYHFTREVNEHFLRELESLMEE